MNQAALTYIKLGIVGLAVAGCFGLAMTGRISATEAIKDVSVVVGAVAAGLGISGAGSAIGSAMMKRKD